MSNNKPFVLDLAAVRKRAREHIEKGAVTQDYKADRATVIKLLNEALATEIVCVLRYKRHYYMASGINANTPTKNRNTPTRSHGASCSSAARRTCRRKA